MRVKTQFNSQVYLRINRHRIPSTNVFPPALNQPTLSEHLATRHMLKSAIQFLTGYPTSREHNEFFRGNRH
jgi:hypothetical protein